MIERDELMTYLTGLLQPHNFEDYGPNGLQVEGRESVERMVVSPSASLALFERAVEVGADTILVHHGLFWKNDPREVVGPLRQKLTLLLEHRINLIGYHLPLDFHPEYGNNRPVLQALGLQNIEPLAEVGYCGEFTENQPVEQYFKLLDNYYESGGLHLTASPDQSVRRVALVSGGGASYLRQAIGMGVDAFITGEGSEWVYSLARENGVAFSAMGHYITEMVGPRLLAEHLCTHFDLSYEFFTEPNPF